MKNGYFIACQGRDFGSSFRWWKKLWSLNFLVKVKHFIWTFHNFLPTYFNLPRRHIDVDFHCPICGVGAESTEHSLFLFLSVEGLGGSGGISFLFDVIWILSSLIIKHG